MIGYGIVPSVILSTCVELFLKKLHIQKRQSFLINKQTSPNCALFCCKARRTRLERERSEKENTRRSRMFLPTS